MQMVAWDLQALQAATLIFVVFPSFLTHIHTASCTGCWLGEALAWAAAAGSRQAHPSLTRPASIPCVRRPMRSSQQAARAIKDVNELIFNFSYLLCCQYSDSFTSVLLFSVLLSFADLPFQLLPFHLAFFPFLSSVFLQIDVRRKLFWVL